MSTPIYFKSVAELSNDLSSKKISSVELTKAFIARTKAVDSKVKAFNSYDEADALAQAKLSDERRSQGKSLGVIDGIPIGFKDVISVKGQPLTASPRNLG